MPRTGRPKSDNPMINRVVIRFTEDEYQKLKKHARENNLTIAETIRKGIRNILESKQ